MKDLLVDILADLTEILEGSDVLLSCDKNQEAALRQSLLHGCWNLESNLQSWLEQAGSLANFRDRDGSLVRLRSIESFAQADLTLLYWTTCVLLYETIRNLVTNPKRLPPHVDALIHIRRIGAALPSFYEPESGTMSLHRAAFPLGICLTVLRDRKESVAKERKIFLDLLASPRMNSTLGKFLSSIVADWGTPQSSEAGLPDE
jgi:hypothetical protein